MPEAPGVGGHFISLRGGRSKRFNKKGTGHGEKTAMQMCQATSLFLCPPFLFEKNYSKTSLQQIFRFWAFILGILRRKKKFGGIIRLILCEVLWKTNALVTCIMRYTQVRLFNRVWWYPRLRQSATISQLLSFLISHNVYR